MINKRRVRIIRKIIYAAIVFLILSPSVIISATFIALQSTMEPLVSKVDRLVVSQLQSAELKQTSLLKGTSTDTQPEDTAPAQPKDTVPTQAEDTAPTKPEDTGTDRSAEQPEGFAPQTSSYQKQEYLGAQYYTSSVGNMNGKPDDSANNVLTVSDFCTMLNTAFGYDVLDTTAITLKTKNTNISVGLGLMQDFIGQGVSATDKITREQAAYMLYRAFRLQATKDVDTRFTDINTVSSWAVNAVLALEQNGYLKAYDNKFLPEKSLTRGEADKLLSGIHGTIIDHCIDAEGEKYKNVTIREPGLILRDAVIEGDLYITEGVRNSDVWLEDVSIGGRLIIAGGRDIYTKRVTVGNNVVIDKPLISGDNAVRYRAVHSNNNVVVRQGNLREIILTDNIILSCKPDSGRTVFNLYRPNAGELQSIKLANGVVVGKAALFKPVRIQGGSIGKVEAHTNGVVLDADVQISLANVEALEDIKVHVGNRTVIGKGINNPLTIPPSRAWPVINTLFVNVPSSDSIIYISSDSGSSPGPKKAPAKYAVTMMDDGNGTAYSFVSNAAKGEMVAIVASPKGGFKFNAWEVDPNSADVVLESTSQHYSRFTMPNHDVTITASFVPNPLPVTVITDGKGLAEAEFNPDDNTITITADSFTYPNNNGYVFEKWVVESGNFTLTEEQAVTNPLTFDAPLTAVTIQATFERASSHTVTMARDATSETAATGSFMYGKNGGALVNYTGTLSDIYIGDIISIRATPISSARFVEWRSTSSAVVFADEADATTTFRMPDEDVEITAVFDLKPIYNIEVTSGGNGTASASPTTAYEGTSVTATAVPAQEYLFDSWEITSNNLGTVNVNANPLVFNMPADDVEIKAKFVFDGRMPLTVTVDQPTTPTLTPLISTAGVGRNERTAQISITGISGLEPGDTVEIGIAPNTYGILPWNSALVSPKQTFGSTGGSLTVTYDGTTTVTDTGDLTLQLYLNSTKYKTTTTVQVRVKIIDGQSTLRSIPVTSTNFTHFGDYANGFYSLQALARNYKMTGNITSSGTWTPVGTNSPRFSGTFDGDGYTISGLNVNINSGQYVGMFGAISGTVRNLTLTGASVLGGEFTGGITGQNYSGTITNCGFSGTVSANGSNVGGIAGYNTGSIQLSYSAGSVTGTIYVGGIAGRSTNSVQRCYSTATVVSTSKSLHDDSYAGGIIGDNMGTVTNCYATGDVTGAGGSGGHVGGVVGENAGTVSYCYARGSVTGLMYVGGVAGHNHQYYTVRNCVALNSSVNGSSLRGRVVGQNVGTLSDNYAAQSLTGTSDVSGIDGANVAPANYNGASSGTWWSNAGAVGFSTGVWTIANSAYPRLQGFTSTQPTAMPLMLELEIYTVTVTADNGGIAVILPDGETEAMFASGETVTVKATPDEGNIFEKWLDEGGNTVSTDHEYSFTVEGDVVLTAVFTPQVKETEYTVTVTADDGGIAVILPDDETEAVFSSGETVTVKATPDEGNIFEKWHDEDGNTVSTDQEYSFTVEGDVALTAVFGADEGDEDTQPDLGDGAEPEPPPQEPSDDMQKEDDEESTGLDGDGDEDSSQEDSQPSESYEDEPDETDTNEADTDDKGSPENQE